MKCSSQSNTDENKPRKIGFISILCNEGETSTGLSNLPVQKQTKKLITYSNV